MRRAARRIRLGWSSSTGTNRATGRPWRVMVRDSPLATLSRSRGRWVLASFAPTVSILGHPNKLLNAIPMHTRDRLARECVAVASSLPCSRGVYTCRERRIRLRCCARTPSPNAGAAPCSPEHQTCPRTAQVSFSFHRRFGTQAGKPPRRLPWSPRPRCFQDIRGRPAVD